ASLAFGSLSSLFENQFVQRQLGHRFLQAGVLFLEILQSLCLTHLHATIFLAPAIIGLLCYANLTARDRNRCPLALQHLYRAQMTNNLPSIKLLPCHKTSPSN